MLHGHAEQESHKYGQKQRNNIRQLQQGKESIAEKRAEGQNVALNKVHQAGGLVDQAVAQRDQSIYASQDKARDQYL